MPLYIPSTRSVKLRTIECPQCGKKAGSHVGAGKTLGIPVKKCRGCGCEVRLPQYILWQSMTKKQKAGTVLSIVLQSVFLGAAFGGLIGAALLLIVILLYPSDLSAMPVLTVYALTTAPPVLVLALRPWVRFIKVYRYGKKHPAEMSPENSGRVVSQ